MAASPCSSISRLRLLNQSCRAARRPPCPPAPACALPRRTGSGLETYQASAVWCLTSYTRSSFRVCGVNVVLCRHPRVTREPAFGTAWIKLGRLERVGRCIISPLGICPAVRIRELLGIHFNERERFQADRHRHEIGGRSVPLEGPLDLGNLEAIGEELAVARNASPECVYHHVIRRDHLQAALSLTDGDILPGLVSPEIGELEPIWYSQRILVLLGNGLAARDGDHYRNGGACSGDAHHGRAQKPATILVGTFGGGSARVLHARRRRQLKL